jgi:hypothetical protein
VVHNSVRVCISIIFNIRCVVNFLDYLEAFKEALLAQISHLDHCKSHNVIEIMILKLLKKP